jgi:hypothetical protein
MSNAGHASRSHDARARRPSYAHGLMATRSIVTSQPDVACDVCERRLLRGEQPEVFLSAGQPRIVCELCAPRAAHQGWTRSSDEHALGAAPLRTRRARGLFERLRQTRRGESEEPSSGSADPQFDVEGAPLDGLPQSYEFLGADAAARAPSNAQSHEPSTRPVAARVVSDEQPRTPALRGGGPLHEAIDVFNTGEYPRRVASLTRSLGAPEVSVRPGEAVASSVVIVIAWELCWYTYEVDLDDMQGAQARAIAQGTELAELRSEDRLANALADERGSLELS